jgi:putative DNA primase/helicase
MSRLRDEIIKGHSRGWSYVLLDGADGKVPAFKGWTTSPRLGLDQCLRWVEGGKNIGLRTGAASMTVVIDQEAGAAPLDLPRTVTAKTGRDGRHFYFKVPLDADGQPIKIGNSVGKIALKTDIRGDGGQVVLPGSVNPQTGGQYAWMPGLGPDEIEIAELPIEVLERDWKVEEVVKLTAEGKSQRDIAETTGIPLSTVRRIIENSVARATEIAARASGAPNGSTRQEGSQNTQIDNSWRAPVARANDATGLTSNDVARATGARQLPPHPKHPNSQSPNRSSVSGVSGYLKAALDNEVTNVANAPEGERNKILNDAAFNLGMLISGTGLDRSTVETALIAGAEACGLHVDSNCGPNGIRKTIRSGIEAGILKPRRVEPAKRQSSAPSPAAGALPPHRASPADDPPPSDGFIALGGRDPGSDKLVLSPKRTLPTAEAWQREFYDHPEGRTLHTYAEMLLAWDGSRFAETEERAAKSKLQPWLHDALRYAINKKTGAPELVPFESNPGTVNAALESIKSHTHLPSIITPPAWLTPDPSLPAPRDLLPYRSAILHVPTGKLLPQTPAFFNINALDFDYDPKAEPPELWIKFLEQLWGDDIEAVQLLQEWMGYCLVGDTSQQKMLLMVGPKRSGKGTIGRILGKLVGAGNVVGPTTSSLAGPFGLQPLIGKSLAIVSDARFSGESVAIVTERLLCITGEDPLTIDRKFMGAVTMKLSTRFVFLTNELPRMRDASGALPGRFLILKLDQSFYGKEDVTLTEKLMSELPGILLWAIEGLKRLRQRGRFVMPKSSQEALEEMEELASPVLAFVRECCEVGPGRNVYLDELYAAWEVFCQSAGRTIQTTKPMFGKDLQAVCPGVAKKRGTWPYYEGITLKEEYKPAPPPMMGGLR